MAEPELCIGTCNALKRLQLHNTLHTLRAYNNARSVYHLSFPINRYGEIMNINLVRDKKTGKTKGFCFLCYEDQRSTILAVDNLNGIKVRISN